ncbi:MAG: TlpA disulfide reductase family protein [Planctomycetota bacterium]
MSWMKRVKKVTAAGATAFAFSVAAVAGEFPDDWYWTGNDGKRPAEHLEFEGQVRPGLEVQPWVNGELTEDDLAGNILVIDFWATWCGPCRAAIPHNNEIHENYRDLGVLFLGVCTDDSPEDMMSVIKADKPIYPNAFIDGDQVMTDWPVKWFPTYAVVDRTGTVRAVGLRPDSIERVIDALLAEEAPAEGRAAIPGFWLEGSREDRARLAKLEEQAETPPVLEVEGWMNSEAKTLEALRGKVVVLSFGATWAAPWLDSVEQLNALQETYGEQGLEIIGICATHEGYALAEVAETYGIKFPVCIDVENRTNRAYGPNNFPDLYLIDKTGNLRIADLKNDNLESAIKALLAEEVDVEDEQPDNGQEAE